MDRQIYPSYVKIRLMRSKVKGIGTIVREILSEICENPTYANPTYARFTVRLKWSQIHIYEKQFTIDTKRLHFYQQLYSSTQYSDQKRFEDFTCNLIDVNTLRMNIINLPAIFPCNVFTSSAPNLIQAASYWFMVLCGNA